MAYIFTIFYVKTDVKSCQILSNLRKNFSGIPGSQKPTVCVVKSTFIEPVAMAYYSELQSSFNSCQPWEHARVKWHSRYWDLQVKTSVYLPLHRRAIIRWKFQPSSLFSSMQSYKSFVFEGSELCYDWLKMYRKVHIFWLGHKILRNLHLTLDYST